MFAAVLEASKDLSKSRHLKKLLEIVLALGNYMNRGQRGNASGFRIGSLNKIGDTKSSLNKRVTLLHYLTDIIEQKVSSANHSWNNYIKKKQRCVSVVCIWGTLTMGIDRISLDQGDNLFLLLSYSLWYSNLGPGIRLLYACHRWKVNCLTPRVHTPRPVERKMRWERKVRARYNLNCWVYECQKSYEIVRMEIPFLFFCFQGGGMGHLFHTPSLGH